MFFYTKEIIFKISRKKCIVDIYIYLTYLKKMFYIINV